MQRRSLRVGALLVLSITGCAIGQIDGDEPSAPRADPPKVVQRAAPFAFEPGGADAAADDAGSPSDPPADEPPPDAGTSAPPADAAPIDTGGPHVPASVADVTFANVRGESIQARVFVPAGAKGARHPAVIVLHGSGGLFKDPSSADLAAERICSPEMSSQFVRWAARLNARGYVAIFPDSFGSRGYCDEVTDPRRDEALPPVPGDENGKTRRLLSRLYDLEASARYLCAHDRVRCDSIGLLGFSNGASAVALGLHHRLATTLTTFAKGAASLGVAIPPITMPAFRVGVAYYPGCGFDGIMTSTTDDARVEEFLYPSVDLQILHGEKDSLLPSCVGTRATQADRYALVKGLPDRYHLKVYPSAGHGFDDGGCDKATSDPDVAACADGTTITLGLLSRLDAK